MTTIVPFRLRWLALPLGALWLLLALAGPVLAEPPHAIDDADGAATTGNEREVRGDLTVRGSLIVAPTSCGGLGSSTAGAVGCPTPAGTPIPVASATGSVGTNGSAKANHDHIHALGPHNHSGSSTGGDALAPATLTIPNSTSSGSTTAGRLHFDTNGGTATVPMISVGNGSAALPTRTCWREPMATITAGDHYITAPANANATQNLMYAIPPMNVTISALVCTHATDMKNGNSVAVTLYRADESSCAPGADEGDAACTWSSTALTCTITGDGSAPHDEFTCRDTTNAVQVTTAQRFQWFVDRTGTFTRNQTLCSYMVCSDATW